MADPIDKDEGLEGCRPVMLALASRTPEKASPRTQDWRFPSTAQSVRTMRGKLRPFIAESGLPDAEIDDLVLAACEAAANGVEHARHPTEPFFDVRAQVDGHHVRIVVRDYGRWTMRRADPGHRGRGLRMMTMLAAVSLTSGPTGTSVTLQSLVDGRPGG